MKIDVSKIDGYESMNAEEKLKALEEFEIDMSGYVDKKVFDKTASDLAGLKKKERENLSEAERIKAEQEENLKKLEEEIKSLRDEKELGELTSNYLALGYDEKLAKETAKAFMNKDMATVFANQKSYQDSIEKKIKADVLKGTGVPGGQGGNSTMTKEQFRKLSDKERVDFATNHPEEYKAMYNAK